jgi:hypothetical protein
MPSAQAKHAAVCALQQILGPLFAAKRVRRKLFALTASAVKAVVHTIATIAKSDTVLAILLLQIFFSLITSSASRKSKPIAEKETQPNYT